MFVRVGMHLVINAVAIWVATKLVHNIELISPADKGTTGKVVVALIVAAVFGLVNAFVKPIVKMLSLPLMFMTLGLFVLVVNALMLLLTAKITDGSEYGLEIHGFGTAVLAGIVISVVNWLLSFAVPDER
ncbi:phage holin family protein [Nocardia stercoris]|uniref:Phage holin family protein n=1 Tax=Nocardia stercoris TaxID=2483361 RepID=A0A3M2KZI8_9NOCA|nr:phage holin family protein [Nocardia stercoris]RMI30889.1 phage holin family protein [Nocardia stercoris]